jgi:hypothetical protein
MTDDRDEKLLSRVTKRLLATPPQQRKDMPRKRPKPAPKRKAKRP